MNTPAKDGFWALTEKEKQTLRLIVRGYDAKSTARRLGLSVHTINERLRDARRKMTVSSSREAARLLLEAEGGNPGAPNPDLFGDTGIGGDATRTGVDQGAAPTDGAGRTYLRLWIIIGVFLMTFALGLLALAAVGQVDSASPTPTPTSSDAGADARLVDAARSFLTMVDQGRWDESYQATGKAFRKANTTQLWAATSEKVRAPLGTVIARTFVSEETVAAPPAGYEVVKFQTRFANKAEVMETVTLDREDGNWRVVGVTIG